MATGIQTFVADAPAGKGGKDDPRITLLDLASTDDHHRRQLKLRPALAGVWAQRINARRFVFDREASRRIGEMLNSHVDLLVDNIEFARTPFPTCYFEFDARAMWRAWRPEQPHSLTSDERVGYLVHEGTVLILSNGKRPNTVRDPNWPSAGFGGIAFRINRPQTVPLTLLTGHNEADAMRLRDAYVFGGQRQISLNDPRVVHNSDGTITMDEGAMHGELGAGISMPELHGAWTHGQIAAPLRPPVDLQRGDAAGRPARGEGSDFSELCFMAGGDPLTLVTLLLLLNQPSKFVSMESVNRSVGLWRGARKVFKEHHVVRIKLDRSSSGAHHLQPHRPQEPGAA